MDLIACSGLLPRILAMNSVRPSGSCSTTRYAAPLRLKVRAVAREYPFQIQASFISRVLIRYAIACFKATYD